MSVLSGILSGLGSGVVAGAEVYEKERKAEEKKTANKSYFAVFQEIINSGNPEAKAALKKMATSSPSEIAAAKKILTEKGETLAVQQLAAVEEFNSDVRSGQLKKEDVQSLLQSPGPNASSGDSQGRLGSVSSLPTPSLSPQPSNSPGLAAPVAPEGQVLSAQRSVTENRPRTFPDYFQNAQEQGTNVLTGILDEEPVKAQGVAGNQKTINALSILRARATSEGMVEPGFIQTIDGELAKAQARIDNEQNKEPAQRKQQIDIAQGLSKSVDPEIGLVREENANAFKSAESVAKRKADAEQKALGRAATARQNALDRASRERNAKTLSKAKGSTAQKKLVVQVGRETLDTLEKERRELKKTIATAESVLSRNSRRSAMKKLYRSGSEYIKEDEDGDFVRDKDWFKNRSDELEEVRKNISEENEILRKVQASEGFVPEKKKESVPEKKKIPSWIKIQ